MLYLRGLLFYSGMAISILFAVPMTIILLVVPYSKRFRLVSNWARFNLWWLAVTCNIRAEISGLDNIPDSASILMSKHQSAWETLAIQLVFPPQVWILKRELLWIPVYGWGLATMQPIAIDRSAGMRALKQIVRQGTERLRAGLWVVVFPEGTRTRPGEYRKYQPGGAMLAEKSGNLVVPVAHNAGYYWPRNSFRKWPGTIHMVIGKPVDPAGKKAALINTEVEQWIESTVATLPKPAAPGTTG